MAGSRSRKLREELQKALRRERHEDALGIYEALERVEPKEARWPHRRGDLLKRLGQQHEAVEAYETAVDLYAKLGFVARAAAMAKVITGIDPERSDVLGRLTVDESEEPDTTTWDKPAEAEGPTIELTLSPADVRVRPLVTDSLLSDWPTPEEFALFPSTSLFADLPKAILEQLVGESRLVDLDDGERMIERGTTADAVYAIVEGTVFMEHSADAAPAAFSEGDVVGISAILGHPSYSAAVTSHGQSRALRISKLLLDRLVEVHPPLETLLLEVVGRRLVSTLVQTSPLFSELDDDGRLEFANTFEVHRAAQGTVLLRSGLTSDGLYMPMHGHVVARDEHDQTLGTLKLGRVLGQESVLTRAPSPITVEAITDVLVLRMTLERFDETAARHPTMVALIESLATRPLSTKLATKNLSLMPDPATKSRAAGHTDALDEEA